MRTTDGAVRGCGRSTGWAWGSTPERPWNNVSARRLAGRHPDGGTFVLTWGTVDGMTTRITHWIDGKAFGGSTERSGDVFDPATGQVTGRVDLADVATVDLAVSSASTAAETWRTSSLATRARVLFRFRQLLDERQADVAAAIT